LNTKTEIHSLHKIINEIKKELEEKNKNLIDNNEKSDYIDTESLKSHNSNKLFITKPREYKCKNCIENLK